MSITLEQIVQTLESLAPSDKIYSICYYMEGVEFRFHIQKRNDANYRLEGAWFHSRSMGEFAAIREGIHYVDYIRKTYPVRRNVATSCTKWLGLQIIQFLEDSECHRMVYYVEERLRLPRGPIRKRGESVIEAEMRFFEENLNKTRGSQIFFVPVGLKTMVLDHKHDTDSDTEESCMYKAKALTLFHSLHGQFPEA